jgi:hypothetical protein
VISANRSRRWRTAGYVEAVLDLAAGPAILDTAERYLANDRSVDLTAKDRKVYPNTPVALPHADRACTDGQHRPLQLAR